MDLIEVAFRASITYHLGHEQGPFGYMDTSQFKPCLPATADAPAEGINISKFRERLMSAEKQSSEMFICHYRAKYSNSILPIWMLTEIISFGTLSRITESLLDREIRRKIARDFGLSQDQLISWLRSLRYIRNVRAHHGRLWNRPLSVKPELLPKWKAQCVTRDRLYVVLLMESSN